jgi:PAS domain S-box-containing protein
MLEARGRSLASTPPDGMTLRNGAAESDTVRVLHPNAPMPRPCPGEMKKRERSVPQAYLAAIVESSDDAILSKDTDGIIQSANAATERIFGYSAAELVGKSVRVLVPPELHPQEDEILARIRRGERIDHFETVRLTKDNRRIDISLTVSPVRDASGRVIGASKIVRDITERTRARATQARLAAIVASSTDAIVTKDLNGIIHSCNQACEQMFGYGEAELVGRSVLVLIPPERHAEEDMILSKVRRGERIDHFETVRLAKDGRRLDISLAISPIKDDRGNIIGVAKIARDITEQKRLERELAAQQERLRVTLASIGDAVIACDIDGRVTFLNQSAEAMTGWPASEAAGRGLHEVFKIVNERTREPVQNPASLVMRSGHIVGLANHTVLIHRDGSERPIADSAAPIRDGAGIVAGAVLVFRDVTEQRRAEDALAEQREWLETTIESIGDAVIATDMQGRIAFMNPVAERLTSWSLDDARGRQCAEVFRIVNERTRKVVDSPVQRVLAEGVTVGLANHTVLIAKDGVERPIDDSGAPIRSRSGRIVGVVLVFRDITERRRAEADRHTVSAERERLLEAERAARSEAERASRVKDEFVAMVSHELRTPLNAILGWTHLMSQSREDRDILRRGLDVIIRNTRVQAQLISDLLDMSRIVSGKLRLTIEKVDLKPLVEGAIDTVQQSADAKSIPIRRQIEPTNAIAGDPSRLQQIVWNLLWNAVKFTPEGGTIVVGLRQRDFDVELTVTDTGVGIRPEFLPHIFDRFEQGNPAITRRFGGLGLGLAIVKHLVDLHGGTIGAESEGEGKGARFTVLLPTGSAVETAAGGTTASEHGATGMEDVGPDPLQGMRILVVEDEKDTLDFVSRFLVSCGAEVVVATSAAQALALLPGAHVNVLISDIGLPDVDGYELLREVRRMDASAAGGIPAIALTAYARAEDRLLAFRAGFQAHVAKPVDPNELLGTIVDLAKLARLWRPHR